MHNPLGDKIRKYREEHGMSLRAFGDLAGISYTYVKFLEDGTHNPLDDNILEKLSRVLNINITITPNESIKVFDSQSSVEEVLQAHKWEQDMLDFIKPENSVWIRLAKEIKENGYDHPEVKTIAKFLSKK